MKRLLAPIAAPLVALACRLVDDVVPTDEIQAFLINRLNDRRAIIHESQRAEHDIDVALRCAQEAGLVDDRQPVAPCSCGQLTPKASERLDAWISELPAGQVVTRNHLAKGAGAYLDQLAGQQLGQYQEFIERSFESLLRSIEVHRRGVFARIRPACSAEKLAMESHDIAIAFSRYSRRRNDLRFLNTSLKLLDWSYPTEHKVASGERLARFLLALAEQELAIKVQLS